ncbi:hypothetical protein BOX15_Mlig008886g1, partial [Macrostomum lignano]
SAVNRLLQKLFLTTKPTAKAEIKQVPMSESADLEAGVANLAVDCPEQADRVGKWLARNDRFCRRSPTASSAAREEAASDDSGRPSSVDTDAAASPRQQQQKQQQQKQQSAIAAKNPGEPSSLATVANQDQRARLIVRGASPVPGDENDIVHQFLIPNKLGGSMVGTRGRNINYIRAKSGASVWISRNFFDKKTQVVNVRGPVNCVKIALQVIKKRFPELDVKPINTAVPIQRNPALQPTMCQLNLPVGALVDVIVCAMCRGTTLFMQQPTHPSFHHLEKMDFSIQKHYADQAAVPSLPRPVNPGAVCVAPFGSAWHRAIIADVFPEDDMVLMKYLDWGGYERMPVSCLKQIRTEMMHLPFQAVEGHLAYVSPVLTQDEDPEAQLDAFSRMVHEQFIGSRRLKCQVVYFNDVNQPCVYVYTREGQSEPWRCLQDELVAAGLAQWFPVPRVPPQMPQA